MKYIELFETPIGNLEVGGMNKSSGTFPERDRKLLTNSEHIKKIRYSFANTPYLFHFYFINRTDVKYLNDKGKFTNKFWFDRQGVSGDKTEEEIKNILNINIPR